MTTRDDGRRDDGPGLRRDEAGRLLACPPGEQYRDGHVDPGGRPWGRVLAGCGGRLLYREGPMYRCLACGLVFSGRAAATLAPPGPGQPPLPGMGPAGAGA